VKMKPRVTGVSGRTVTFDDGSDLTVDAVIWATGFGLDHSGIKLPIFDHDGKTCHRRGVTDVPGLYFIGLPWQHTRGSALLGWVQDDAEYIAGRLALSRPEGETRASLTPRTIATGTPA
jgi:putative flavoprotein involved in K+ transport